MNCPFCGMPTVPDRAEYACGTMNTWGGSANPTPACREIAAQKARADKAEERVRGLEEKKWRPIEDAPRDNKRPLVIARFDDDGELVEMDWDATWEYWEESWEMSHINGWDWTSAWGRVEEPTHWAYQDEPLPALNKIALTGGKGEG